MYFFPQVLFKRYNVRDLRVLTKNNQPTVATTKVCFVKAHTRTALQLTLVKIDRTQNEKRKDLFFAFTHGMAPKVILVKRLE